MTNYIIFDGEGYFVKLRRVNGKPIFLWSPRKRDAAHMHFREVAQRLASMMPQPVRILNDE